jgi:hypothetical protein
MNNELTNEKIEMKWGKESLTNLVKKKNPLMMRWENSIPKLTKNQSKKLEEQRGVNIDTVIIQTDLKI